MQTFDAQNSWDKSRCRVSMHHQTQAATVHDCANKAANANAVYDEALVLSVMIINRNFVLSNVAVASTSAARRRAVSET